MAAGKGMVKAEPIRRVIEGWLAEKQHEWETDHPGRPTTAIRGFDATRLTPKQELMWLVWGTTATDSSAARTLFRILDRREGGRIRARGNSSHFEAHTKETINFDTADLILTKLGLWHLWHEDPELHEEYMNVDLAYLDQHKPTVAVEEAA